MFFSIDDVLTSDFDEESGAVVLQTGDVETQTVEHQEVEMWGPLGLAAKPAKADPGQAAAQVLILEDGDQRAAIAYRDLRRLKELLGNLHDGETCLFASTGMGTVTIKADGSVTMGTTSDNTNDGATVSLTLAPTELRFTSPFFSFFIDESGAHFFDRSGAEIHMGSVGGLSIGPVSVGSIISIVAAAIHLEGSLMLGRGPVFMQAAITPNPSAVPVPLNPTGGSLDVLISTGVG